MSGDVLHVTDGSLNSAVHKLEKEGWSTTEWKQTENNRRAKFLLAHPLRQKQLQSETVNWRLSTAISKSSYVQRCRETHLDYSLEFSGADEIARVLHWRIEVRIAHMLRDWKIPGKTRAGVGGTDTYRGDWPIS